MADRIRVVLADDHPVVRQGLRAFLDLQDDLEVVGEAADGEAAVAAVEGLEPDVLLLDVVMPGVDGIQVLHRVRDSHPDVRVVVLTSFVDEDKILPAVRAGAAGHLLKDVQPAELADAIRTVHRGEAVLHPAVAARVMREVATSSSQPSPLTDRELDVLRAIARGRANKEIARELGVKEKTVKTHVSSILSKLHLADRTQAAIYAVRSGIADEPDPGPKS